MEMIAESGNFTKDSSGIQDLVTQLITDWQYLFSLRGIWSEHWTEIARRIYPMESYLFQNFQQLNAQGDKRNQELYDSTGALAIQRFGSILDSLLTPRDQFWHILRPEDEVLMRDKATRLWFEKTNNTLFRERYQTTANFSSQNQKQYLSLGAYGTSSLLIDKLDGSKGLRYKNVHLGECYLQENHQGIINKNCRHFMLTASQAVTMWREHCPKQIQEIARKFPERQYFFLHWTRPNDDRDPERKDFKGMMFSSFFVSIECHELIFHGGYRQFPYAISRYYQAPNETYGRSPAMDVLPSLKTLNEQKKSMLKQAHRILDPVLLANDDGVLDAFSLEPGALNFGGVSADGRPMVTTLPTGNIQLGKEAMDEEKALINQTFLVDLFQMLTETKEMTATEVMERTREKGILTAPTIGRQQSEYLGPMIERELDLLASQGMLDPQPKMLKQAKGQYKIVYDSPISRTQKSEWASGAMRTIQVLTEYAQATGDNSPIDVINIQKAAQEIARINGVPESWLNDPKAIAALAKQRQQQQQQQAAIQAAPAAAGLMKAKAMAGQGNGGGGQ